MNKFVISLATKLGTGKKTSWVAALSLFTLAIAPIRLQAQSYSIDRYVIASGGGTCSNGVFSLTGTIGQPAAGTVSKGGPYTVTGGFLVVGVAVQTPGAPTLQIVPAKPGFATISWGPAASDFVLQQCASLTAAAWTNAPTGATNPVTIPVAFPTLFYRLNKP